MEVGSKGWAGTRLRWRSRVTRRAAALWLLAIDRRMTPDWDNLQVSRLVTARGGHRVLWHS